MENKTYKLTQKEDLIQMRDDLKASGDFEATKENTIMRFKLGLINKHLKKAFRVVFQDKICGRVDRNYAFLFRHELAQIGIDPDSHLALDELYEKWDDLAEHDKERQIRIALLFSKLMIG
jgi:hypothetical protein